MRSWVLAAGLLAAAAATGAQAADLYDGPPPDRYGSAYDDPRYADIYRYPVPPPRYAAPPPRAYERYAEPPIPRERVYREDDRYEPKYLPGPRRHSYAEPPRAHADRCLPREVVKERLLRSGWHDFHDGDVRGDIATVRARRPSGRLFDARHRPLQRRDRRRPAAGAAPHRSLRRRVAPTPMARRRAAGTGPTEGAAASRLARRPRQQPGPSQFSTAASLPRRA